MPKPHVFAIAAISADGFIARNSHQRVTWTSKEDKAWFHQRTLQARVCVMGGNTYRTINQPLPKRLNIVYTTNPKSITPAQNLRTTQATPQQLITDLAKEGFKEVAICGGSGIYTLFLKAGLLDTIYITVEPILFGQGVNLFTESLDTPLTFKKLTHLSPQTILLEFAVNKSSS